jgi:hypothetical protein
MRFLLRISLGSRLWVGSSQISIGGCKPEESELGQGTH